MFKLMIGAQRFLFFFFRLAFLCLIATSGASTSSLVPTTGGNVVGKNVTYNGVIVTQYLGIPYAAPPLADLRFRRPRPHSGWNGTLRATQFGPSCMQYLLGNDAWLIPNKNVSEDCLQLNVFIPRIQNGSSMSVTIATVRFR